MSARVRAVGAAVALIGWSNWLLPAMRLGPDARAATNGALAVALTAVALRTDASRSELGLEPGPGLRRAAAVAAVPVLGYSAALAVPAVRARLAAGPGLGSGEFARWVGVRIPIGTVLAEELFFRSLLYAAVRRAWPRAGGVVGALAFGLWHVRPARVAAESVAVTVAVTAASSLLFDRLRREGGVAAPALLHLSVNVGGAVAARWAAGRLAR
ncbi:CPBP family intramembrane glutamic endopeptidase [Rhodococcus kronopolitis]|uniref:CPBP family intramembrane glutamic endopeptidase n=1 Tax=Rhodococcus kronopolitis TaxID=1460226 RepID=A0ABV9FNY1_9NOCA